MRAVIRTEASHAQGMGDLVSSLALARALQRRGHEVFFAVSPTEAALSLLAEHGQEPIAVTSLDEEIAAVSRLTPEIVIVNKLSSPVEELSALKEKTAFLVTMEDTGPGAERADLRVNVLYPIPNAITDLSYFTLRDEVLRQRGAPPIVRAEPNELLVMQGGADTYGFLPKIVRALEGVAFSGRITVVAGPAFQHHDALAEAQKRSSKNVEVVFAPPSLPEMMRRADLAITAAGLTVFELLCLGIPSVVVAAERFEVGTAERLAALGALVSLGFGGDLEEAQIARATSALLADRAERERLSRRGYDLCDGRGCERLADLLEAKAAARLSGSLERRLS